MYINWFIHTVYKLIIYDRLIYKGITAASIPSLYTPYLQTRDQLHQFVNI